MYAGHFSINNIPYGIASSLTHPNKSVATRFEDNVIFLDELAKFDASLPFDIVQAFSQETVHGFAALPKSSQTATRTWIQSHLSKPLNFLPPSIISPISNTILHLPLQVGDFTDFSCSENHVLNAGEAVMGKREHPPGFLYFPVGYHGRCSTIVVSGTPIKRPMGQYRNPDGKTVFGASQKLDYELEVAAVIGKPSMPGQAVNIANADDHIFGLVLLNDWSARDIQSLEMPPLGPLNGKSFATTISPWIITLDALAPFKTTLPQRSPDITLAPYLQDPDLKPTFNFDLKAFLQPEKASEASMICSSSFSSLYWTMRDLVAHQTVNGCSLRTGDLLATGTISGQTPNSHGCLLELASKGGVEVKGEGGGLDRRVFLRDGDTVSLTAVAGEGVGFGECVGTVMQAV